MTAAAVMDTSPVHTHCQWGQSTTRATARTTQSSALLLWLWPTQEDPMVFLAIMTTRAQRSRWSPLTSKAIAPWISRAPQVLPPLQLAALHLFSKQSE